MAATTKRGGGGGREQNNVEREAAVPFKAETGALSMDIDDAQRYQIKR